MAAVRVPPSACRTSQSRMMVRSPRAFMSTTARRLRPMRRWISWRAAAELTPLGFARSAGEGGAGKHTVLGGDPTAAGVAHPAGNAGLDSSVAEDAGVACLDEHGTLGGGDEAGGEADGAESVGGAAIGPEDLAGCGSAKMRQDAVEMQWRPWRDYRVRLRGAGFPMRECVPIRESRAFVPFCYS